MIYVFTGNDEVSINKSIADIKRKFSDYSFFDISNLQKNKDRFMDLASSQSIFGKKKLIDVDLVVSDGEFLSDEKFGYICKQFKDTEDILILNLSDNFAKNTKVYKAISSIISITDYSKKQSFWNFEFCDEFILKKNKKRSLDLLSKKSEEEMNDEFYQLLSLMQTYVRMIISSQFNNKFWNLQKPFFRSKFSNIGYNYNVIIDLYKRLLELDMESKSTSKMLKNLLFDFVLFTEY